MSRINVLVANSSQPSWVVDGIAESVRARPDMSLVAGRWLKLEEVDSILEGMDPDIRCALVLVGRSAESDQLANQWLAERQGLVVMYVDVPGDRVRIGLRNPETESLLTALAKLIESVHTDETDRIARIELKPVERSPDTGTESPEPSPDTDEFQEPSRDTAPEEFQQPSPDTAPEESPDPAPEEFQEPVPRPLLQAAINWVHAVLQRAVEETPDDDGDAKDVAVTQARVQQSLDPLSARTGQSEDDALDEEFAKARQGRDPLAIAARVLKLGRLEFRLLLLGLAPEMDIRFQRCIGFLLDDMGKRVGTLGLYCSLLEIDPQVRGERISGGGLAQWLAFERDAANTTTADEPLRVDPFFAQWLLGDAFALENDPRIRRSLRLVPWPGATLLERHDEIAKATALIDELRDPTTKDWIVLDADDVAAWRALVELGAGSKPGRKPRPIRVDPTRLTNTELLDIEDCARRIGRMARLTANPLIIDISKSDGSASEAGWLHVFFTALRSTKCKAAVICSDKTQIAALLETFPYKVRNESALPKAARVAAMRVAARKVGAFITGESAELLASQYPLQIDVLEHATTLAGASRSKDYFCTADSALAGLTTELKEFAAEGVSNLVERIEPIFSLEQVVLPPERKQQLHEIVDHVRLAPLVLDEWKFRDQLPYGRGVAALFFGASGTGKTMAAMGIARRLGIQILRLDLSRVVSKYIGDTEKNLDRVFTDAQRSGALILIDEADALFGKRSEVRDARDRYANMEVAYLLQRMEAYEGLAILTTNMRKNLDPAFTRRLRFIIDFPRPDADAREKIWRQCLPLDAHEISDEEFRQLARRIDITGGQIRQTTLRAAFIAAAAGELIRFEHIAQATRAELAKLGIPPVNLDVTRIRRVA